MKIRINSCDGSFKMRGDWEIQTQQLKREFSQLTDADLIFKLGEEKELLRRLEKSLNKTRVDVINIIKSFQS